MIFKSSPSTEGGMSSSSSSFIICLTFFSLFDRGRSEEESPVLSSEFFCKFSRTFKTFF